MVGKAITWLEEGTRGRKRGSESESRVRGKDEREKAWWGKREWRVEEGTRGRKRCGESESGG